MSAICLAAHGPASSTTLLRGPVPAQLTPEPDPPVMVTSTGTQIAASRYRVQPARQRPSVPAFQHGTARMPVTHAGAQPVILTQESRSSRTARIPVRAVVLADGTAMRVPTMWMLPSADV